MFARIVARTGRSVLQAQALGSCPAVSGSPAVVSLRGIAIGDNSEPYIPTDAGFKEFNYNEQDIYWPPGRTVPMEKVVDSVDECKWDKPLAELFRVRFGQSMPTIHDDKAPERDLVNHPRYGTTWPTYPEGVRLVIFPDSWFRAMYPKTGVTGPYFLTLGVLNFLFSKEWLVYEHEMHVGVHIAIMSVYVLKKWGPLINRYLEGLIDTEAYLWNRYQQESIADLETLIAHEKQQQESLKNQTILFEAKRENVHLQREAEYRSRLMTVFQEVKRKLDYQIAAQEAGKQFAQRHMVNWILDNVTRGLTNVSEKETLSKCIADLKSLSAARARAI